ncbi:MAG: YdcF family protein [Polyangiales bacterium]
MRSLLFVTALSALLGCVHHAEPPPPAATCACGAHEVEVDRSTICGRWKDSVPDELARSHVTFPELDDRSCYVRVRYEHGQAKPDPVPTGCGYPDGKTRASRDRELSRYDAIASGETKELPFDLACNLPPAERLLVARANATTLRKPAEGIYPYAAIATFGYGEMRQLESGLSGWRPGDACPTLTAQQMQSLGANVTRAGRAAQAYHARVAPVVIVSGGAVHSPLYEAYLLDYLLTCRFGVPRDAVLMDPCADHTHTNVRNSAGLVVALGGRTGYVVTDGLQAGYLQEWTLFDLIGGSIDQRALRDWGYLLGSFRQASVGANFGFWLTPYRFWAAPREGLGSLTCDR